MTCSSHRFLRLLSFLAITQLTSVAFGQTVELTGHGEKVHGVAFSPDGKLLATASFDDTVKIWDFATKKDLFTLKGHTRVYCVAFNNDGSLLASGGDDKSIKIWDPKDGKLLRTLTGHTAGIMSIAFSPDGKILASASADKSVRLWNPGDGKEIKKLGDHASSVYGLAFTSDGQTLASCGQDGFIKIWSVKELKETKSIDTYVPPMLTIVDVKKDEPKKEEPKDKDKKKDDKKDDKKKDMGKKKEEVRNPDAIYSIVFSPDNATIIAVGSDKYVHFFSLADGKDVKKIGPAPHALHGVVLSKDGKNVAVCTYGGSLRVYDLQSGNVVFTQDNPRVMTYCVAFTPDGRSLVTGGEKNNAARIVPLSK